MKNDYEIRGEVTVIFLKKQDGTILETLIDTEDLDKVKNFPGRFFACKQGNHIYATGRMPTRKGRRVILARWVYDEPKGMWIDHINHNTLDNRKSNIRMMTQSGNGLNRIRPNKNSLSGVLGVYLHKQTGKWCARLMVNRRGVHLGLFDSIELAAEAVKEARRKEIGRIENDTGK